MGTPGEKDVRRRLIAPFAVAAALALHAAGALADPAAKVYLPSVVQGEVELELLGGYQRWRNQDDDRLRQGIVEAAYGITSWWKSEIAFGATRVPGSSWKQDEIEWENIFALTEPGEHWLDLGLFAELAYDHPARRYAIAIGPMFQKEFESVQANVNVFLERELGSNPEPGAAIKYQWQLKWRGSPYFEPGAQGFGTLGRTNDFGHATENRIGPAIFGKVSAGGRNKLKYDAAVLFGLTKNTPDTTIRFQLEFEMY